MPQRPQAADVTADGHEATTSKRDDDNIPPRPEVVPTLAAPLRACDCCLQNDLRMGWMPAHRDCQVTRSRACGWESARNVTAVLSGLLPRKELAGGVAAHIVRARWFPETSGRGNMLFHPCPKVGSVGLGSMWVPLGKTACSNEWCGTPVQVRASI